MTLCGHSPGMRCVGVRGGRNMFSHSRSKSEISRLALTYPNLLRSFCLLGTSRWSVNTPNLCIRKSEDVFRGWTFFSVTEIGELWEKHFRTHDPRVVSRDLHLPIPTFGDGQLCLLGILLWSGNTPNLCNRKSRMVLFSVTDFNTSVHLVLIF